MDYIPISPFMRPVTLAHLRPREPVRSGLAERPVNKWEVLRSLAKAQAAYGLGERDLTVLQGLLSFFPSDTLGGNADMVVFPSNKAICERLNGMACSTMRRHLARLIGSGLLQRRDSPNGKRYMRKGAEEAVVFGFDLTPLYQHAEEIARAAEAVREAEERVKRLREVVSLMRRDLAGLCSFGDSLYPGLALWADVDLLVTDAAKALRRKLSAEDLNDLKADLEIWLDRVRAVIDRDAAEDMSSNALQFEQHYHDSNTNLHAFEPRFRKALVAEADPELETLSPLAEVAEAQTGDTVLEVETAEAQSPAPSRSLPNIPLHLVVTSCPSLADFSSGPIRHWHQLYAAAAQVRPAMGISASAWEEAQTYMGPEQAAVVVAAMLERFAEIRSPGGYLRALTDKAMAGQFSCGPMVMALLSKATAA